MDYLGYRPVNSTVRIPFTTHAQTGAAVAPSNAFEAADVRVYKDGSATERASQSGYTMTSPFDSVVGLHWLDLDLSDNTTAGFWAAGSHYDVVLTPDTETVDGLAVVRVLASFDIGVAPANLTQMLGTALTETSGQIAAAFKQFFDVGTPTGTMKAITNVVTATNLTNAPTAGDLTATMKASVNAEADTALLDYDAPTHAELTSELALADDAVLSSIASLSIPSAATIATAVWASATRLLTAGTNIALAKGVGLTGLNDLSAAAVNAEVLDVLNVDTFAEPGQGTPAATASLAAKIGYLFKAWRNRSTQTAVEYALYADDATTKDQEAVVSDDGTTFTRGEVSTGA